MKKRTLLLIALLTQLGFVQSSFAANAAPQETSIVNTQVSEPLDLNQATREQLMNLPGVGQSKAEAIIAYREQVGKFLDTEQLTEVKGIGKAMFDKLKHLIVVR